MTDFSYKTREQHISGMESGPLDAIIIGGGVTGAGIARDAAMRGLRVAVMDRGDFGGGTSSRSSRLVHGGLRYLELYDFKLVFEACRERRTLLDIAPHLVWPLAFVFPVYREARVGMLKLRAGLILYDMLAAFRNISRHRMLGRQKTLQAEPQLKSAGLKGSGRYFDAQCNDVRLALATIRSAANHGALTANYLRVDGFERAGDQVTGVRVTDMLSRRTFTCTAPVVVNATGPWSDEVRAEDNEPPALRRTKGVHIIVPRSRLGNDNAITFTSPIDGRVMFILPWGEHSYVGTTDTDDEVDPDRACANDDDIVYLLRSANAIFPNARLTADDVVASWAGVRPLVAPPDPTNPSAVSREHQVLTSPSGLLSVVGGKLTTYRAMAAEVTDIIAERLTQRDGRAVRGSAPTDKEPLPGGEVSDITVLMDDVMNAGYSRDIAERLVRSVGSESAAILNLARQDTALAQPLSDTLPILRAQIVHAVRREMAVTLSDVMVRRTHLFYETKAHGVSVMETVADLMAAELQWDDARTQSEMNHYQEIMACGSAFQREL